MINFDHHVAAESARLAAAVRVGLDAEGPSLLDRPVPSCPDWRLADLLWHMVEVQNFWVHILGDGISGPEGYDRIDRPADDRLLDLLTAGSAGLNDALVGKADDEPAWSWSPRGGTVGWIRRRQAHEALVHRVDAELTVDDRTGLDETLAADGVDELLRVMLDVGEPPDWASFDAEPSPIVLDVRTRWWTLVLGRFTGVDPDGGSVDLPAASVVGRGDGAPPPLVDGATGISASASEIFLWLWGRGGDTGLAVDGDAAAVTRLRATAADATR